MEHQKDFVILAFFLGLLIILAVAFSQEKMATGQAGYQCASVDTCDLLGSGFNEESRLYEGYWICNNKFVQSYEEAGKQRCMSQSMSGQNIAGLAYANSCTSAFKGAVGCSFSKHFNLGESGYVWWYECGSGGRDYRVKFSGGSCSVEDFR